MIALFAAYFDGPEALGALGTVLVAAILFLIVNVVFLIAMMARVFDKRTLPKPSPLIVASVILFTLTLVLALVQFRFWGRSMLILAEPLPIFFDRACAVTACLSALAAVFGRGRAATIARVASIPIAGFWIWFVIWLRTP